MYIITIDLDKCEGCGDCIENCPVDLFKLVEEDGKKYAEYIGGTDDCIGCMSCDTCEEGAVTVEEM